MHKLNVVRAATHNTHKLGAEAWCWWRAYSSWLPSRVPPYGSANLAIASTYRSGDDAPETDSLATGFFRIALKQAQTHTTHRGIVAGVRPQQVRQQRPVLRLHPPLQQPDVVHGAEAGGQAAVHAEQAERADKHQAPGQKAGRVIVST